MPNVNFWAVLVSVIVMFVLSLVYYSVVSVPRGTQAGSQTKEKLALWKVPLELFRSLVVALVLAILLALIEGLTLTGAVGLALLLWLGFPAVLLAGSMLHENVSWRLAVLHAGDWLIKLVVVAVILELWSW